MLARLRLFQVISPSSPVGGFAYSQGMEWAVECGWLKTADDVEQWLKGVLDESLRYLDLPLIKRMHDAVLSASPEQFDEWSRYLYVSRETSELRSEERQRAEAFYLLLSKLLAEGDEHDDLLHRFQVGARLSQGAGFALAAAKWQLPQDELLAGCAWNWLENSVSAAIKLVPLGQSAGQALLYEIARMVPDIVDDALGVKDDELGASSVALAIASSLHETQYCRLFRS